MLSEQNRATLAEARRLYDLGFAIHWLLPRSKRPAESGWTKGGRKDWKVLERAYRQGMNVGVRLGAASYLGTKFTHEQILALKGTSRVVDDRGYLAVIDCDVKSKETEDLAEMLESLDKLFPGITGRAPHVLSGRGNGSEHFYVRTRSPGTPALLARSERIVKVAMPSARPSRKEREALSEIELAKGIRLRPAWEISGMGEGQQVVLPPSIHPDTGRPYRWGEALASIDSLPFVEWTGKRKAVTGKDEQRPSNDSAKFLPVPYDLVGSTLSNRIVDLITSGAGVEDRSAAVFSATLAMCAAGFTDDEILTILTDQSLFLGGVAFEHAQTSDRARAARWIREYNLAKARAETSAAAQFDCEVEVSILDEKAAEEQELELLEAVDWRTKLDRTQDGKTRATLRNCRLILVNAVGSAVFRRNEFAVRDIYGVKPPWNDRNVGETVTDTDVTNILFWFAKQWGIEPNKEKVNQSIAQIASENAFNPVRDFLDGLEWDGVPRVDTWLKHYLNAEGPEPYLSDVSRKFLCAMVARIYRPGIKFDHMLILEGNQGVGKSTAASILGGEWFADPVIAIGDKDAIQALHGKWVIEMGELSGLTRADTERFKAYVSCQSDYIRLPYGQRFEEFPRQSVFIGSTNKDQYSKDTTGNRRLWPVWVNGCRFADLKRDRNQLLAEAAHLWMFGGELLYLDRAVSRAQALEEQAARVFDDPWNEKILDFLASERAKPDGMNVDRFQLGQLFGVDGPFSGQDENDPRICWRVGDCLKRNGFVRRKLRDEKQARKWFWLSPEIREKIAPGRPPERAKNA